MTAQRTRTGLAIFNPPAKGVGMPEYQGQPARRTLGNDEIHVRFRDKQDLVRQAIGHARSVTDSLASPASPDERVSVPVYSFRTIVEALRLTYKTLGETIHQDLRITSGSSTYPMGQDEGRTSRLAADAEANEVIIRFRSGEPVAREALRQAALYSEYNENAARRGDQIEVPVHAFQTISDALVQSNDLLVEILASNLETLPESAIPGPAPDHGDYGGNWDPFNTGNWFRD